MINHYKFDIKWGLFWQFAETRISSYAVLCINICVRYILRIWVKTLYYFFWKACKAEINLTLRLSLGNS